MTSASLLLLAGSALPGASSCRMPVRLAVVQLAKPAPASSPTVDPPLCVDRGPGLESLVIPRAEELDYVVEIDLGILGDLRVGTVTLVSGVEPAGDASSSSDPASGTSPKLQGWIRSEARGSYLGYTLKQDLDVLHRAQAWPALLYTDTQTGSENRRHALRLGVREGVPTMQFEEDHHCRGCAKPDHFVSSIWPWSKPHHCNGCKRMEHREWDVSITHPTLPGTVDLLSAVYLARAMVAEGSSRETFPVLDQENLWILTVRAKGRRTIDVPAGRFKCMSVELETRVPEGEVRDKRDFSGLFGLQGSIHIGMEAATGVPVQIAGDLPVPVIGRLGVNVRLTGYRGTPHEFAPVR